MQLVSKLLVSAITAMVTISLSLICLVTRLLSLFRVRD